MAKKKETWPQHKMGKFCGYDVTADGKIIVAPRYADEFDRLGAEAQGVNKMLEAVTSHAMRVHAEISKQRRALWVRMSEDYGLDTSVSYSYAPNERAVYLAKQEAGQPKSED
jgi:hypothetical protein